MMSTEKELPVQDVEVGREELLGLLEQQRLPEEGEQMGEEPPAVRIEASRPPPRAGARGRDTSRGRATPADRPPISHSHEIAGQVHADQHEPVGEPAVEIGPDPEERQRTTRAGAGPPPRAE